jgi:hypothetical protein
MIADHNNLRLSTQDSPDKVSPFPMCSGRPKCGATSLQVATSSRDGEAAHINHLVASQTCEKPNQRWKTVKGLAKRYDGITTESALRNLIWQAEAYAKHPKAGLQSNGFLPVIVRPPNQRKVLLDCIEFERWLTANRRTAVN